MKHHFSSLPVDCKVILACIGLMFIYLALVLGYTIFSDQQHFWLDELFTVASSSLPANDAFYLAFHDNNPPLFPVFMWFWVKLFSDAEFWGRLPSVIFAVASVAIVFKLRGIFDKRVLLLWALLIISNNFWLFYAFEARSFMAAMFFSLLCLIYTIENKPYKLIAAGIVLGLLHFYGTLLASLLFAYVFFSNIKHYRDATKLKLLASIAAAQLILFIYPVFHVTASFGKYLIGGNFWITSSASDAILYAIHAAFGWFISLPATIFSNFKEYSTTLTYSLVIAYFIAFTAVFCIFYSNFKEYIVKAENRDNLNIVIKLTILLIVFVVIILLISTHTPIAIVRHFIVIIPAASLLLAIFIAPTLQKQNKSRNYALFFIVISSAISPLSNYTSFVTKWINNEKWELISQVVQKNSNNNEAYYLLNFSKYLVRSAKPMFNYYAPEGLNLTPVKTDEVRNIPIGSNVIIHLDKCGTIDKITGEEVPEDNLEDIFPDLDVILQNDIEITWHYVDTKWALCKIGYATVDKKNVPGGKINFAKDITLDSR